MTLRKPQPRFGVQGQTQNKFKVGDTVRYIHSWGAPMWGIISSEPWIDNLNGMYHGKRCYMVGTLPGWYAPEDELELYDPS